MRIDRLIAVAGPLTSQNAHAVEHFVSTAAADPHPADWMRYNMETLVVRLQHAALTELTYVAADIAWQIEGTRRVLMTQGTWAR